MSVVPNQSWQTSGTPDYISRKEVIDLLEDLSGVDLSGGNLFYTPNPLFSTIGINPTGQITGGNFVQANGGIGISSVIATYNRMFPVNTDSFTLGIRSDVAPATAYQPLALQQLWCKNSIYNTEPTCVISPASLSYVTSLSDPTQQKMILGYNTPESNVGLFNISSINGQPPNTAGTTFTTLTGTTLNATNVNTTNLAGVSQFNGLPKIAPYRSTYNITGISGYSDNTATIIGTITPGITIPANALCAVSVPVKFGGFAPGSPAVVYFNLGLRVGGAGAGGGIFYTTPVAINTNLTSGSSSVMISGIFPTPTASATNTIEIILISQQGVSVTCPFSNPVSPANVYSISVLS